MHADTGAERVHQNHLISLWQVSYVLWLLSNRVRDALSISGVSGPGLHLVAWAVFTFTGRQHLNLMRRSRATW